MREIYKVVVMVPRVISVSASTPLNAKVSAERILSIGLKRDIVAANTPVNVLSVELDK